MNNRFFFSQGTGTNGILDEVTADRQHAIVNESRQGFPSFRRVINALAEQTSEQVTHHRVAGTALTLEPLAERGRSDPVPGGKVPSGRLTLVKTS
jgi:hypothetical protein